MKPRTCPNCDYQYSVKDYFKKFSTKGVGTEWDCPNCGKTLTFNFGRRFLVAAIAALPVLLGGSTISGFFEQTFGLESPWGFAILLPLCIIWGLSVFTFDGFKLTEDKV
jgi:CXXC-20-CXXC protein